MTVHAYVAFNSANRSPLANALVTISQTPTVAGVFKQEVLYSDSAGTITATIPYVDSPWYVWVSSGSPVNVYLAGEAYCFTLNGVDP